MPGSSTAPTWLSLPQGSAGRGFGVTIQSTSSGTANRYLRGPGRQLCLGDVQ